MREEKITPSKRFGTRVFHKRVMEELLPPHVYQNVLDAQERGLGILPEYADVIAGAMKDWAISLGATYFTHLFQPLTGATAEKHDGFIEWHTSDWGVVEKFTGKQLIIGEPDASSFPSGGLRSTFEARGYTGWDPTSPAFIWDAGDVSTLCIPSVFFSWTGEALGCKIPLLRSDQKINHAALRLARLTGIEANQVFSTMGPEQEYFLIDRSLYRKRPDLVLSGRCVFGSPPAKGQELQDHYFGTVKDRIVNYMQDFESKALELGIPVKTRHNEVAPAQHEVALVFEKASLACDHNITLMEIMRQVAVKHDLACLLHEKPFEGLNGSGKHCNWSLATDTGINLLNPTETPEETLHFLILMIAVIHGIDRHQELLSASIGSSGNDHRLGGHEAPPAIISVYLGETLEALLENLMTIGKHESSKKKNTFQLGIEALPELPKDNTDRNRTSPFAFTGDKFEFRAAGSALNLAFPVTVINTIVAESLNEILDEIEKNLGDSASKKELFSSIQPVLSNYYHKAKRILYSGDNYDDVWLKEAKKRKLPHHKKSVFAFPSYIEKKTIKAFSGVLAKEELQSRMEVAYETYASAENIEMKLMQEIFRTQILPAAMQTQEEFAASLSYFKKEPKEQKKLLITLTATIEKSLTICTKLEKEREKAAAIPKAKERANAFAVKVLPLAEDFRQIVDSLEKQVTDKHWPLPKSASLLFFI